MSASYTTLSRYFGSSAALARLRGAFNDAKISRVDALLIGDSQTSPAGAGRFTRDHLIQRAASRFGDLPATPLADWQNVGQGFLSTFPLAGASYPTFTAADYPLGFTPMQHSTSAFNGWASCIRANGEAVAGGLGRNRRWFNAVGDAAVRLRLLINRGSSSSSIDYVTRKTSVATPVTGGGTVLGSGTLITAGEATGTGFFCKTIDLALSNDLAAPFNNLGIYNSTPQATNCHVAAYRWERIGGVGMSFTFASLSGSTAASHLASTNAAAFWSVLGVNYRIIFIDLGTNDADSGTSTATFKTNILALMAQYRAIFPSAVFVFLYRGQGLGPSFSGGDQTLLSEYAGVYEEITAAGVDSVGCNARLVAEQFSPLAYQFASSPYKGYWTTGTNAVAGEYYFDSWIGGSDTAHTMKLWKCTTNTATRPVAGANWADATWKPNTVYAANDLCGWYSYGGGPIWLCTVGHTSGQSLADYQATPDNTNPHWVQYCVHDSDGVHETQLGGQIEMNAAWDLTEEAAATSGTLPSGGSGGLGLTTGSASKSTGTGLAA